MKQYKGKDGCFDEDGRSEDSDCGSGLDLAGHSIMETEVDSKNELGQDTLPVLSIGSFTG